jgi:hypothetical protein
MKEQINASIGSIREKLSDTKKQITADATEKKKGVRSQATADKKVAREKSKQQYEKDLDTAYNKIKG